MPKRRKKSRYRTGVHKSIKCNTEIKYRSGWEKQLVLWLDSQTNVISYSYETIKIPYVANVRTGKIRNYIPDFLVEYSDGSKKMIEVKRSDKVNQAKTQKKLKAGEEYCKLNKIEKFEIWQNEQIKQITLVNKVNYPNDPIWNKTTTTRKKRKRQKKKLT